MLTAALSVLLLSCRPGWLGRVRATLESRSQKRLSLMESTSLVQGEWDAVVLDWQHSPSVKEVRRHCPWSAVIVLSEIPLDDQRLKPFQDGAQAVACLSESLFELVRESVASIRSLRRDHLCPSLMRHAEKMDTLSRLSLGITHDFKHLVQVIQSGCCVLQKRLDLEAAGHLPESALALNPGDTISSIKAASDRAHQLVSRLLSMASPVQEAQPQAPVHETVQNYGPILASLKQSGVRLQVDTGALASSALCDPVVVGQVLLNLVTNAVDAAGRQGTVWVQLRNCALFAPYADEHLELEPGCYTILEVTDNGPGIRPELRELIFEPFFSTRSATGGTGLGLPSVLSHLRSCGGQLTYASQEGVGTTFAAIFRDDSRAPEAPQLNGKALIVEPELSRRDLLRSHLETCGLEVYDCRDWATRQVAFPELRFDLIFCSGLESDLGEANFKVSSLSPVLAAPREVDRMLQCPWDLRCLTRAC